MGCVQRLQQLFLTEEDPPAAQCRALGCAGQSLIGCPCAARPGPCSIPMPNPPSLAKALPLLSTMFLICTSFFNWDWSRGIHARAGPGWAGTASSGPGGDTGLRLGLGGANKHNLTVQPGWAQKALSVTEPLGGSSLIKGCRS